MRVTANVYSTLTFYETETYRLEYRGIFQRLNLKRKIGYFTNAIYDPQTSITIQFEEIRIPRFDFLKIDFSHTCKSSQNIGYFFVNKKIPARIKLHRYGRFFAENNKNLPFSITGDTRDTGYYTVFLGNNTISGCEFNRSCLIKDCDLHNVEVDNSIIVGKTADNCSIIDERNDYLFV